MAIDAQSLKLYLVTDPHLCAKKGVENTVEAAARGGVTMVQLRDKDASTAERVALATRLKPICAQYKIPLVINDDVEAALLSDVDGVHVGQGDMAASLAREKLRKNKILGLSVETIEAAKQTPSDRVDYVGISPIYATPTKSDHKPPIGFDGLADICSASDVYTVAIGGLKIADCTRAMATGVNGMAVVSAICGQDNPYSAAVSLRAALDSLDS